MTISIRTKKYLAGGALLLAGTGAGATLAVTASASADDAGAGAGTSGYGARVESGDPTQGQRSDEELLTGTLLAEVTAAVEAEYPDATIQRVETDSDGAYEAHLVTSDGQQLVVQVDEDLTVTGTQEGPGGPGGLGGPEGQRGPGGPGDMDGAADGTADGTAGELTAS